MGTNTLLIIQCDNEDDIFHAGSYARENNLPIFLRSGGTSYAGFSSGDQAELIDHSQMNNIEIEISK